MGRPVVDSMLCTRATVWFYAWMGWDHRLGRPGVQCNASAPVQVVRAVYGSMALVLGCIVILRLGHLPRNQGTTRPQRQSSQPGQNPDPMWWECFEHGTNAGTECAFDPLLPNLHLRPRHLHKRQWVLDMHQRWKAYCTQHMHA
jgi:hypothetical protein